MEKWLRKISQFLKADEGPTAVEYAVMLALIVVVCLIAITAMGTAANKVFGNIALQTATSGS
jgi:pilus assembly protein Flp/PilA